MDYTVKQLSTLAGVTPRTLRHYDNMGLLCPKRRENGYRLYGGEEVGRLQQILFYREAGLELTQIANLLDDPAFNTAQALRGHIQTLQRRRAELDALINTAQKTLKSVEGERQMDDREKFEGFKQKLVDDNEAQYGQEVRERWGDDAANAANAKMMNMTQEKYAQFEKLGEELNQTLAEAVKTKEPGGALGQKAARLHKEWLCFTWPQYSGEAHKNLAQMYLDDERFTGHYEKIAPGAAQFLKQAIDIYVDGGEA